MNDSDRGGNRCCSGEGRSGRSKKTGLDQAKRAQSDSPRSEQEGSVLNAEEQEG